jgi:hypothetical protein
MNKVEEFVGDCKNVHLEVAGDIRFTLGAKQMRMIRVQSDSHRIYVLRNSEWNPVRGFEQREEMELWDMLRVKAHNTKPGDLAHYDLWEEL